LRRVFVHLSMPYRLMAEWALATGRRSSKEALRPSRLAELACK
jgi:hypothetical protein